MLEIDISLFFTGVNSSIYIRPFYERLLNVGIFEILDSTLNANVKAAGIIDTVFASGESDYSIKNNTSTFGKVKFYKPPVLYQPDEKYILDIQQNFININGESQLTQGICSIQIPTYATMDYPKSLKIMATGATGATGAAGSTGSYMTGSYHITPHLTAIPAYPAPHSVTLTASPSEVQSGGSVTLTPTFSNLFGGAADIKIGNSIIFSDVTSGVATANAPAITTNTTYTLTATNIKNVSATATASVTIN
jgi:hypothetical protein